MDATRASTLGCGVDRCMVPPSDFFVCRVSGEVNSEAKSKALERCVCYGLAGCKTLGNWAGDQKACGDAHSCLPAVFGVVAVPKGARQLRAHSTATRSGEHREHASLHHGATHNTRIGQVPRSHAKTSPRRRRQRPRRRVDGALDRKTCEGRAIAGRARRRRAQAGVLRRRGETARREGRRRVKIRAAGPRRRREPRKSRRGAIVGRPHGRPVPAADGPDPAESMY